MSEQRVSGKLKRYQKYILLLFTGLMVLLSWPFLMPLIMGTVFTIVLYPLHTWLQRKKLSEMWSALSVTLLFAALFLVPIALLVFFGVRTGLEKINALRGQGTGGIFSDLSSVDEIFRFIGLESLVQKVLNNFGIPQEQVQELLLTVGENVGLWLVSVLQKILADLPSLVMSNVIILITLMFCLLEGKKIIGFIKANSFFDRSNTDKILSVVRDTCFSVIAASVVTGLIQGGLMTIASLVTQTSGVALIFLITFLSSFLPVVGTAPVTIAFVLHGFFKGSTSDWVIFLIFGIVMSVSDNIIRPYIINKAGSNLHPFVAFISAIGGLNAMGFYGLFIGPLIAGIFIKLLLIVSTTD